MSHSMLKTLILSILLISTMSSAAETGWYGKAGVSYGFEKSVTNDTDTKEYTYSGGPGMHLGFGYAYEIISFEAEYTFNWLDNDQIKDLTTGEDVSTNGHQSINTVMVNTVFHPVVDFDVVPYIGAGVGYAMTSWDSSQTGDGIDSDDTTYAYQILLGTYYDLTRDLSLNIEYRHRGLGTYTIEDIGEVKADKTNEIALGLLYHF